MTNVAQEAGLVPEWTMADRLRKSLDVAGIGVSEMADELGYTRESVGRWIHGRAVPRKATLAAWALRTGVDRGWLETGCAIRDSNPEPAGLKPRGRADLELVA